MLRILDIYFTVFVLAISLLPAEEGEGANVSPEVYRAIASVVHDTDELQGFTVEEIRFGSVLGGQRQDMFVIDLRKNAEVNAGNRIKMGVRLWAEQDEAAPHGYRVLSRETTMNGTTIIGAIGPDVYNSIADVMSRELLKPPFICQLSDESFGGPELPPIGVPVQYFGLIQAEGSPHQRWIYFGEVSGTIQLVALIETIAIE